MSGTVFVRPGAPARPALTAGEATPSPRPWAAALPRPAARILLAGGLTLAGWLLGAALSGNTASAAETTTCQHSTVSTVEHGRHGHHHRTSHRETSAPTCAQQPAAGDDTKQDGAKQDDTAQQAETPADETTADTQAVETKTAESPAAQKQSLAKQQSTKDVQTAEEPSAKATTSGSGLLGGLVGNVLNVVGGTLTTVNNTVGVVTHTVSTVTDTLSHTVLAPLTQPPANNPNAPVLLPLDDILDPILNGASNSAGVTATVPDAVTGVVTQVTSPATTLTQTAPVTTPATAETQTGDRTAVVHLVEVQHTLPAVQEQPRDSGVHARNGGGDSTPGLPGGGTTAPSAPAPTAAPGHDGPGGARPQFALHTDDATTTQLKLIGASRDHDVDGAGREAALPTTSPD
ncbi:hypothetical protein ACIOD2_18905 [Amycolatopsis sp. NPDC088138]|uniref:hypothetical protein n=1 Tax=Amycolatopsis sp. NPDC088138 TaxID=3363938 RepID=UPI0038025100